MPMLPEEATNTPPSAADLVDWTAHPARARSAATVADRCENESDLSTTYAAGV